MPLPAQETTNQIVNEKDVTLTLHDGTVMQHAHFKAVVGQHGRVFDVLAQIHLPDVVEIRQRVEPDVNMRYWTVTAGDGRQWNAEGICGSPCQGCGLR